MPLAMRHAAVYADDSFAWNRGIMCMHGAYTLSVIIIVNISCFKLRLQCCVVRLEWRYCSAHRFYNRQHEHVLAFSVLFTFALLLIVFF